MTLQDLFDQLILERTVVVQVDKKQAESLRVQLVKKWGKYKRELDALGFLSDDLANCSLCRTPPTETEPGYTFSLAEFARPRIEYTVLVSETSGGLESQNNEAV